MAERLIRQLASHQAKPDKPRGARDVRTEALTARMFPTRQVKIGYLFFLFSIMYNEGK